MSEKTTTVTVDLGARGYDILIGEGLLQRAGQMLGARLPGRRFAVVTDANVADLHLRALESALAGQGLDHASYCLPAGENTKSFDALAGLCERILADRFERDDAVIALGGGVVGDLSGFAAAIIRRGMPFVQIPTSLLAQVDSAVGGKTGINTSLGKNLVGSFHQPALVLADTGLLDTLPAREFRAGYAEMVKYGLIDRPDFFDWLEGAWRQVFAGGQARISAIAESCRAKAQIVAEDERESGKRALLNLGHTFAHALEAVTGYDGRRLVHGEAVAIGIVLAFDFSRTLGLCGADDVERVRRHFREVGLPVHPAEMDVPISPEQLLVHMAQDKKVQRARLTFILTRGIGRAFVERDVPAPQVAGFLEQVKQ